MKHLAILAITVSILLWDAAAPAQSSPKLATSPSDAERLLAKTRALYDTPFQHGLVSFDCALEMDWSKHFSDLLGTVPPAALPTIHKLQGIPHRIFVDRTGATVSAMPKTPDLSGVLKGEELENILKMMTAAGLNAWLPSSTDLILPLGSTTYSFEKLESGYKLKMEGENLQVQLLLDADLHVTSGIVQKPTPLRMETVFERAPNGFVLASLKTSETSGPTTVGQEAFTYTYQSVQGEEIPQQITVHAAQGDKWNYSLSDCKVIKVSSLR